MACRYEEEIYRNTGKMGQCGCPTCPYKNLSECYEGQEEESMTTREEEARARLAERVSKARRIAEMRLPSITSRRGDGKAKTVMVPGSDGKKYHVIIRHGTSWSVECRCELGKDVGYSDCPGAFKTVCYHGFAAIFTAAMDNGCRVHSITTSLKSATLLKRMIVGSRPMIKALYSHQQPRNKRKWFYLVIIPKRRSAQADIVDLFGE